MKPEPKIVLPNVHLAGRARIYRRDRESWRNIYNTSEIKSGKNRGKLVGWYLHRLTFRKVILKPEEIQTIEKD
jgi:hypothetical protein